MLDLKFIRDNAELVRQNSANRLAKAEVDLLLDKDRERRTLISEVEELRASRNRGSKQKPTEEEIITMKTLGDKIVGMEEKERVLEAEVKVLLSVIPNLTHPDVKVSSDDRDNPVVEIVGEIKKYDFPVKDHIELCESLDLLDLERGIKIAGSKFYFLKNQLALLSLALNRYALDVVLKHGFTFMITPDIAKLSIIENLGFSPRGESSQVYQLEGGELGLIGTAEIAIGGYHADEVLDVTKPIRYVALSHCFRTEAGAASKFSKGIFRVHQFEKLEMFVFCKPEEAEAMHTELLEIEKEIFAGLKIPFRVVDHCTADLGAPSYRTFDLEAWLPGKPNAEDGKGDWAEITSASNCTDYQSRGLNIKYLDEAGERKLVYTLNATANPGPRALIAILENYQQADDSIAIPEVLKPYLPFTEIRN